MKKVLFAPFLLITNLVFAETSSRHFVYLGGGGDPAGENTIFDYKVPKLGDYVRRSGMDSTTVAFDGGHSGTELLVRNNFSGNVSNFTTQTFENTIASYEQQLRSGTIPRGGQLMVVIDSHGAEPFSSQATHNVSTTGGAATNLLSLAGSRSVSLDRLQTLSHLAQEKGVKLAILDFSCHSGASLPLANTSTCVISASGPRTFAYGGSSTSAFSNAFINRMGPGKNLEEVYLEARRNSDDMAFPMISSPEGMKAQGQIYPILMKYLNAHELSSDKFGPEIDLSVSTNSCIQEAQEVETLINLSRQLELSQANSSLEGFRSALTGYADYRRTLQTRLGSTGQLNMREVCGTNNDCHQVSERDILAMNPGQMITQYQNELTRAWTAEAKARARNWIAYYQSVQRIQGELARNRISGNSGLNQLVKTFPEITRITANLARQVAIESRKLYSAMYRPDQDNACRQFNL